MGYKSIYERYRNEISIGNLKAGDRVPSIRVLASGLNVARKTVESAYEILVGEGYLVSQGAKGTFVNPELNIEVALNSNTNGAKSEFAQKSNLQPKHLRLGIPALESFPYKKWLLL
ncbi:GntR family transcriptional regulator [Bartonella sp. HY038]|uniref:GntR family transcriptional regulator n=1 Tax=Bartonella sp. HY038 TaxID=2759660 RepID=UPI001AEE85F5|nr:GntR family transcriptional regulator [Bartonella sp. HY038]